MQIVMPLKARLILAAAFGSILMMVLTEQVSAGQDYLFVEKPQTAEPSGQGYGSTEELFHTKTIAIPTNRFRGKWKNLVASTIGAASLPNVCGEVNPRCSQAAVHWISFLSAIGGLSKDEKINLVNGYVNRHIGYTSDFRATGFEDNWANPFIAIGGLGDCEDFAIAKYFSLILLGFSDNQLRLVIVRDINFGEMHAVTTVSTGETIYVLDNRFEKALQHGDVKIYQPIYSFNQRRSWLHVTRSLGYRSKRGDPAS